MLIGWSRKWAMEMRMDARFLQVDMDRLTLGPSEVVQYIFFFFPPIFSHLLTFVTFTFPI